MSKPDVETLPALGLTCAVRLGAAVGTVGPDVRPVFDVWFMGPRRIVWIALERHCTLVWLGIIDAMACMYNPMVFLGCRGYTITAVTKLKHMWM